LIKVLLLNRHPAREHVVAALRAGALAVLSVDPEAGVPIRGSHPGLRDYRDDVDDVRVIYFVSALRTVVVVAYIEE
jgi:hypothetical protein